MKYTNKQVLDMIKGLGLSARFISEVKEFRINLKGGSESTAYYTGDKQDALNTAAAMWDSEIRASQERSCTLHTRYV